VHSEDEVFECVVRKRWLCHDTKVRLIICTAMRVTVPTSSRLCNPFGQWSALLMALTPALI
jgi:hypothetical protein